MAAVIDGALATARTRITEAFGRFGLTPTPKAPGVIQWNGSHDGRAWEAWLGARRKNVYYGDIRLRRTIGYKLRLEAETPVMMQAYVMPARVATNVVMRFLHRRGGLVLMPSPPPGLEQFRVVTCDPGWTAALLARPEAARLIASLVEFRSGWGESGDIYFQPGRLHYTSPQLQLADVDVEKVAATMQHLAALAREAEQLAAPASPAAAPPAGGQSGGRLMLVVAALFAGGMAILAIGALLIGLVAWLVLR
ncbi:MAG: hypothetical protein IT181_25630 [Acidobacteria bacterium]|nr:hypothetical protein [Acidobacteriota bacterium]